MKRFLFPEFLSSRMEAYTKAIRGLSIIGGNYSGGPACSADSAGKVGQAFLPDLAPREGQAGMPDLLRPPE